MELVSKSFAIENALSRYFTGRPCPKGHVMERWTCNGQCIECMRIRQHKDNDSPAGKARRSKWNRKLLGQRWKRVGMPIPTRPMPKECELCGYVPRKGSLCLDHDHATGKFRGWLCIGCNSAIGRLGDTLISLLQAVAYIYRNS